jgi:hypothetical protein
VGPLYSLFSLVASTMNKRSFEALTMPKQHALRQSNLNRQRRNSFKKRIGSSKCQRQSLAGNESSLFLWFKLASVRKCLGHISECGARLFCAAVQQFNGRHFTYNAVVLCGAIFSIPIFKRPPVTTFKIVGMGISQRETTRHLGEV